MNPIDGPIPPRFGRDINAAPDINLSPGDPLRRAMRLIDSKRRLIRQREERRAARSAPIIESRNFKPMGRE